MIMMIMMVMYVISTIVMMVDHNYGC